MSGDGSTEASGDLSRVTALRLLATTVVVAFILRLWGFTFGLPFGYHFAEAGYLASAWNFEPDDIPVFFGFYQVLVLAAQKVTTWTSGLIGLFPLPEWFDPATDDRATFRVVGRLVSVVLGAAAVVPLYFLGARLWNRRVGLVAAVFLACCFLLARSAHYGTPDATALFFTTWALLLCVRLGEHRSAGSYLAAGVVCGLAVASKALAWPVVLSLVLFHAFDGPTLAVDADASRGHRLGAWARSRLLDWRLALGLVAAGVTFLASTPQLLTKWSIFYRAYSIVSQLGSKGGLDRFEVTELPVWLFYLQSLAWGLGWLLFALALAGVVTFLVRGERRVRLLLVFPLVYFAFLLKPGHVFMARYVALALPVLLLCAAALLMLLLDRLDLAGTRRALVTAAVVLVVIAQPLWATIQHDRLLTETDTRTLGKAWIEENIPEGAAILGEWHSPPLSTEASPIAGSKRHYQFRWTGPYGLRDNALASGQPPAPRSLEQIRQAGYEYVAISSFTYAHAMLDEAEDREKQAFYEQLEREGELLLHLDPHGGGEPARFIFPSVYGPVLDMHRLERPGPEIKVYRLAPLAESPTPEGEGEGEETTPDETATDETTVDESAPEDSAADDGASDGGA